MSSEEHFNKLPNVLSSERSNAVGVTGPTPKRKDIDKMIKGPQNPPQSNTGNYLSSKEMLSGHAPVPGTGEEQHRNVKDSILSSDVKGEHGPAS